MDRPDDGYGARSCPRRVTGIVNRGSCRCAHFPRKRRSTMRQSMFRKKASCLRMQTPWSCLSGCWCRANRLLSRSERLADVLLGILQEAFGATQGMPAAVQNLSSLLIYRPISLPQSHAPTAPVIIPRTKASLARMSAPPCAGLNRRGVVNERVTR
jgi:hypothetical protein